MRARATFCLDDGMLTCSCIATLALRMRVSMSAIGSVIVIGVALPSPARLRDAGDLTGVGHLTQANAAQPERAIHAARPAAPTTPRVRAHLVLGLALLLLDECLLGHRLRLFHFRLLPPRPGPRRVRFWVVTAASPLRANGKPNASSNALPLALSVAVVTIVMS